MEIRWTQVSRIVGRFFTSEPTGKSIQSTIGAKMIVEFSSPWGITEVTEFWRCVEVCQVERGWVKWEDNLGWAVSNTWYLEKTLESLLDCKEIQPVHPKGDQSWVFIGRTDVEAEIPILWPPDAKSWLIGKDPYAGRDWGQEEKGTTEDEMAGWQHRLDGHESEWTPGVGDGQGGLACCDSWGRKESDTTKQLNRTDSWLTMSWQFQVNSWIHV